MGQQHNTHIYNSTKQVVRVVLTDTNSRNADQIISSEEVVCFPTTHGRNTISLFKRMPDSTNFDSTSCATYTDDSDYSFIVKEKEGRLVLVRSKYGNVKEEQSGLR